MTFNTGNPIGSTDARDLSDNAENFDKALNSTKTTWNDRLGVTRDTFEGALSKLSFYRVGTFAAGYTLTNMRQTLEYNGHEYSWAGTFPKVVAAGATPATSGGIGAGAWVDRTDDRLRSDLAGNTGFEFVRGKILPGAINRSLYSHINDFKISALNFGGIVNDGIVDCRAGLESLILTCSLLTYGATIYLPKGKYLLNSYSSDSTLQAAFSQILPLRSNVHIELDDNAELIVGPYFDDKHFTLFCGLDNGPSPSDSTNLNNVHVYGGVISFSGATSKMRTGYKLRVGFQFGKSNETSVTGVTFKDGDLSNCIVAGYANFGKYHDVKDCRFIDLVQDADSGVSPNIDFTACYCNAKSSKVIDCDFSNSSRRGKEIACAVELHKSFSEWRGGSIYGYTRGSYVASTPSESTYTQGCTISGVKGVVTNRLVDLWIVSGCFIVDVMISKNNIRTLDRDKTMTDLQYYGACGLIGIAGYHDDNGVSENIEIKDNIFSVSQTVVGALSSCLCADRDISGWHVIDNQFSARHLLWNDTANTVKMTAVTIKDNRFNTDAMDVGSEFAVFNVAQMIYCDIDIKIPAPIALSKVLIITAGLSGMGNTVKVHDENIGQIGVPVLINDIFLQGATNKTEYPEDITFFIPAAEGVHPFFTIEARYYHKYATIIDKKTLPSAAYLCGSLTHNDLKQMCSLGYYPTNVGGSSYVGRVRLSSF